MFTPYNQRTVTVKITRHELCKLCLACVALDQSSDEDTTQWAELRDKLKESLDAFDEKNLDTNAE